MDDDGVTKVMAGRTVQRMRQRALPLSQYSAEGLLSRHPLCHFSTARNTPVTVELASQKVTYNELKNYVRYLSAWTILHHFCCVKSINISLLPASRSSTKNLTLHKWDYLKCRAGWSMDMCIHVQAHRSEGPVRALKLSDPFRLLLNSDFSWSSFQMWILISGKAV